MYTYIHKFVEALTREINRRDLNVADTPTLKRDNAAKSTKSAHRFALTNDVTRNLRAFPYIARSPPLWRITASIQE